MKKLIAFILIIQLSIAAWAQPEKQIYKATADSFQQYYNDAQYLAIFALFSSQMKAALPAEETQAFFERIHTQFGKIKERTFVRYENTYASYKTQYDKGILSVNISVDDDRKINGLFIKMYTEDAQPQLIRNKTALILPVKGEWTVVWGGDTKEQNYHIESDAQKGALDLVITDKKGSSYRNDGTTNEDYYAFGQELIAPCDGTVVLVVDGIKDNVPGVVNPAFVPGNTVVIKTSNDEYLYFAHFKQHSIVVKQGQQVKQGALLGLCGNSGNSTEAHLHFHIQNIEDINAATGAKTYFDHIQVNGQVRKDYSPVQHDKLRNL